MPGVPRENERQSRHMHHHFSFHLFWPTLRTTQSSRQGAPTLEKLPTEHSPQPLEKITDGSRRNKRDGSVSPFIRPCPLCMPTFSRYPLHAVIAKGIGLLPPGSRMQQSQNPRHLDFGESLPLGQRGYLSLAADAGDAVQSII